MSETEREREKMFVVRILRSVCRQRYLFMYRIGILPKGKPKSSSNERFFSCLFLFSDCVTINGWSQANEEKNYSQVQLINARIIPSILYKYA